MIEAIAVNFRIRYKRREIRVNFSNMKYKEIFRIAESGKLSVIRTQLSVIPKL